MTTKTVQYLGLRLRQDIVNKISQQSIEQFNKKDTGVYSSWLTNDVNTIEQDGFSNLLSAFQIVTDSLFSIIALISFNWTFLPLVIILSFFTVYLPQLIRKSLAKSNLAVTKKNEKLLNVINDTLRGFSVYMGLNAINQVSDRITKAVMGLIDQKVKRSRYVAISNNLAGFSNIVGQLSIESWTGFLAIKHIIPIGVIASSGNLSYNVFNSLAAISPILAEMRSLSPIFEKYNLDKSPKSQNNTVINDDKDITLNIEKLEYSYPNGKDTFSKPVDLTLKNHDKILVKGKSGSGKSTLLKILAGYLDNYRGSIKYNEKELRNLSASTVQNLLFYVDQTPYIFNASVRYNLTLGQKKSNEEIWHALDEAELLEVIKKLPQGLETELTEDGNILSGGQKQRLALARGLLHHKKIYLLDESTSSLDKESAVKVEKKFLSRNDIAVIFVTHQPHQENMNLFNKTLTI